jgi:hypothetical protein
MILPGEREPICDGGIQTLKDPFPQVAVVAQSLFLSLPGIFNFTWHTSRDTLPARDPSFGSYIL